MKTAIAETTDGVSRQLLAGHGDRQPEGNSQAATQPPVKQHRREEEIAADSWDASVTDRGRVEVQLFGVHASNPSGVPPWHSAAVPAARAKLATGNQQAPNQPNDARTIRSSRILLASHTLTPPAKRTAYEFRRPCRTWRRYSRAPCRPGCCVTARGCIRRLGPLPRPTNMPPSGVPWWHSAAPASTRASRWRRR